MLKLGVRCVRRAVSGADLTDFGKAVRVSLLLVLSCVLSPAFAQATEGCAPAVGSGTSSSPYRIAMLCELQGISLSPAAHYELVANIDASRTKDWNYGAGFEPIAFDVRNGFEGSFVSTGKYEISSLTISRSDAYSPVGLFSVLARDATIRGVILVDSHIAGRGFVGSLVGFSEGVIVDSSATGSVFGGNQVGGLVGLSGGSISNSYATGSVFGTGDNIGGLVGNSRGDIIDSYATGSVSGQFRVGGLVGDQGGGSISRSYAVGMVTGTAGVGGLMGNSRGDISNSYATGSVFGTGDGIGGLVGNSRGDISNSYATGSVFGTGDGIGGLVGNQDSSSIVNSYYAARGRNNGLGEERIFAQLRCPTMPSNVCQSDSQENTYEEWSPNVWGFGSATDLPQLLSNLNSDLNLKPYVKSSTELVGIGISGVTHFSLKADYPGTPRESVTLTWSLLFDEPFTPSDFAYFVDLKDGTISTEANGSASTLNVVVSDDTVGKSFYVVLKNNVSVNDDRIQVRIAGASPLVDSGRDQVGTIQASLLSNILSFSATDSDSPYSGGAGLSWSFSSRDIAEDSTVRFNGSTGGGTVEVEVVRPLLDFYGVGSFVLEVKSPAGVKTTLTVTIETVCSTELGEDLMAGQTGAGTSDNPYRIERLCQLQDVSSSPSAYYELATNIDASRTKDWNRGAGFEPIALYASNGFEGSFVSTGNYVISSLTISRRGAYNPVGLFSRLARDATIRGVILVDSHMTGRDIVGSLVGFNAGVIEDSSALGSVSGENQVGGLVGLSEGSISNSYTASTVTGTGFVGGLVGDQDGSSISNSSATGSVSGRYGVGGLVGYSAGEISGNYTASTVTGTDSVGGLVGYQEGSTIGDSYATGSVSGRFGVGGLVGNSRGDIIDSYATGSVFGTGDNIGGLVGFSFGTISISISISNSYATGSVFGTGDGIGGLVGHQDVNSSISRSYASGMVTGTAGVGGLVGNSRGDIIDSYATGSVFGTGDGIGGLVGNSRGDISNSYATGSVFGTGDGIGGLVGNQDSSSIVNSYYAARGRNNGLGEERIFAQLRCPTMPSNVCQSDSQENTYEEWSPNVWGFGSATDLPQLLSNLNSDLNLKPYVKSSTELVGIGISGVTHFSLKADYPGTPRESVTLTWSLLFDEPFTPSGFAYFVDLKDGTISTEANGPASTLNVVVSDDTVGKSFYVVLKNNVSVNDDRIQVRIAGASPLVDSGRDQVGTIQASLLSNILSFSATDSDSPYSGGAGLSWSFSSRDIAEDSTVRFNGSTGGGTVEVEVVRPLLDFYGVGSFVLEVESPAGVKTTLTVTIETVCSTELGEDLMAGQTGAGTSDNPYRIERLCQLQDVSSSPSAYYELATNIDASRTKDWNRGAGFEPIALYASNGFEGSFVSTGNYVISSLTISRRGAYNPVGLFSRLARDATIRGVILVDSHMTGRDIVGSLVGFNAGVIEDSSALGSVSGENQVGGLVGLSEGSISNSYTASTVTGTGFVGGLVGDQDGSSISNSSATGSVSGRYGVGGLVGYSAGEISGNYTASTVTGTDSVGGLVGYQEGSTIGDSYATGSVSGRFGVGGLVGNSRGDIIDSYATGSVFGTGDNIGGLVGFSFGTISNSYATGSVFGTGDGIGGLVGHQDVNSSISRSYASGMVTGTAGVGGLVGLSGGSIRRSHASSTVTGADFVGGLVGHQDGSSSISDSYATGSVSGQRQVGGLVGKSTGSINNSYAASTVRGTDYVGGLVGYSEGNISNTFAVSTISTISTVTGSTTRIGGLVGLSEGSIVNSYHADRACLTMPDAMTSEMCGVLAATYAEWDSGVWDFGSTGGLPTLRRKEGDGGDSTTLRVRVYLGGAVR